MNYTKIGIRHFIIEICGKLNMNTNAFPFYSAVKFNYFFIIQANNIALSLLPE